MEEKNISAKPKAVILDTDFSADSDDVMAVRVLTQMEYLGAVDIVGIATSANDDNLVAGLDGFLSHEGVTDLCIGFDADAYRVQSKYLPECADYYHTNYRCNADAPDALTFYQRAFQAVPQGETVDIIQIGTFTGLKKILEYYVSAGRLEEWKKTVGTVWAQAGTFPAGDSAWNIDQDMEAADYFFRNCPSRIVFCGHEIGEVIFSGGNLKGKTWDLLARVLALHGFPEGNQSYDPITVLLACDDGAAKLNMHLVQGRMTLDPVQKKTFFREDPSGNHYYAAMNDAYAMEAVKDRLERLYARPFTSGRPGLGRVRMKISSEVQP